MALYNSGTQHTLRGRPVYTVSKVNEYARGLLSNDPILSDIWVRGEISNLKRYSSGHVYFTVKDGEAALRCAFFRQDAMRSKVRLADGMQVELRGYITIYPRDGAYQMVVQEAESGGEGALFALFQKWKQELMEKGYFDESRKKPLPFFPKKIAVITSPSGAVLRDIARVARSRWQGIGILLLPVTVQGDDAPAQIAAAINTASEISDVDVIIAGRGGGSMEDLWAFNEECVANAIFACKKPIVSAVGHETDFTIADFCADMRASTPTHAAELCVPDAGAISADILGMMSRAKRSQRMFLDMRRERILRLCDRPVLQKPDAFVTVLREKCNRISARAGESMRALMSAQRAKILLLSEKAVAMGPQKVLERGYAIVRNGDGTVTDIGGLWGDISITMHDGTKNARVLDDQ